MFTVHVTKPNGQVHQVGDNDSGRFLKLHPDGHCLDVPLARQKYWNLRDYRGLPDGAKYWMENHTDHRSLVAALNGILQSPALGRFAGNDRLETFVVSSLCGNWRPPQGRSDLEPLPAARVCVRRFPSGKDVGPESWPSSRCVRHGLAAAGTDLRCGLEWLAYPSFGLYIFRSPRLYLAIRCGRIAQANMGGHAHLDQLAMELHLDGHEILTDPGTYLYTPSPAQRNAYRSVAAHAAPRIESSTEAGSLDGGLFRLLDRTQAECLVFEPFRFLGRHYGYGAAIYRLVEVQERSICVCDYFDSEMRLSPSSAGASGAAADQRVAPCMGYGIRIAQDHAWNCNDPD